MQVKHRHQSMHHKSSDQELEAALRLHRANATVVTGTEGGQPRWERLLEEEGWGFRREVGNHNRDDVWITWNEEVWEPRVGWVEQLSQHTYDGRRAHLAIQKLRHREHGTRVFFMAHHLPAHIQAAFFRMQMGDVRVRAYDESLSTMRDLILMLREKHPNSRFVVTGDWNLNFHSRFVRPRLRFRLRGTGLAAATIPSGTGGSHRGRLIDWSMTDLPATGRVLGLIDASDHKPVAMEYTIERDDSPDTD